MPTESTATPAAEKVATPAAPTAADLQASFVAVAGQYLIGTATLADVETAFRPIAPAHRGDAYAALIGASIGAGIMGDGQPVNGLIQHCAGLKAVTVSRTAPKLSDDQWNAVRTFVADSISHAVATASSTTDDKLIQDAIIAVGLKAVTAARAATSGSRGSTVLIPLTVGQKLTGTADGKAVSATVASFNADDDTATVTVKGSANPVSLSEAAALFTGTSTNGRAFWKLDGRKIAVKR